MATKLKQGDAFVLPVRITVNGAPLTPEETELVEFMLGPVRKLWPKDADFDGDSGEFRVRFGQEDTFSLPADGAAQLDVRVKFRGGAVIGTQRVTALVTLDALSERVL